MMQYAYDLSKTCGEKQQQESESIDLEMYFYVLYRMLESWRIIKLISKMS